MRSDDVQAESTIGELVQQFQRFLDEAHRLKNVYASQITLLVGLETEYISSADLDALDKLLKENAGRIQYIVGSVHHVNGVPIDFDLPTFQRAVDSLASHTHEVFLETYFDAQFAVMQQFRPEIIGHFDLCRLYQPDLRILDFPSVRAKVERNICFAVSYGALFEVNAAAFRKGWASAYPSSDIVEVSRIDNFPSSAESPVPRSFLIKKDGSRFPMTATVHTLWVLIIIAYPTIFSLLAFPNYGTSSLSHLRMPAGDGRKPFDLMVTGQTYHSGRV